MSEYINVKDIPEPEDTQFLAFWIYDGAIECVEWYIKIGENSYMNLNSNNMNDFDYLEYSKFTHWALLPEPPKG